MTLEHDLEKSLGVTIDPRKEGTDNLPACFEAMMVAGQEQR